MSFRGPAPQPDQLRDIRYLFTDIDDTLTTGGRLLPQTFQALWDLHDAGIAIVPVTGGSAGWCEHIVRTWPVAAVIGESGAFCMTVRDGQVETEFWDDSELPGDRQARHLATVTGMLGHFKLSRDQRFRLADVAVEIAGHERAEIDALADQIRGTGASVAVSSIHINSWIGDYNKQTMSARLLERLGVSSEEAMRLAAFVGDSRNDAPMFSYFPNAFGVANVLSVLDLLDTKPAWITQRPSGLGFADIAQTILSAKAA